MTPYLAAQLSAATASTALTDGGRAACSRAVVQQQHERVLALNTYYCQRARRGDLLGTSAAELYYWGTLAESGAENVGVGGRDEYYCSDIERRYPHTPLCLCLSLTADKLSPCLSPQGATPTCWLATTAAAVSLRRDT